MDPKKPDELTEDETDKVQGGSDPFNAWRKSWSTSGDADDAPGDSSPDRKTSANRNA